MKKYNKPNEYRNEIFDNNEDFNDIFSKEDEYYDEYNLDYDENFKQTKRDSRSNFFLVDDLLSELEFCFMEIDDRIQQTLEKQNKKITFTEDNLDDLYTEDKLQDFSFSSYKNEFQMHRNVNNKLTDIYTQLNHLCIKNHNFFNLILTSSVAKSEHFSFDPFNIGVLNDGQFLNLCADIFNANPRIKNKSIPSFILDYVAGHKYSSYFDKNDFLLDIISLCPNKTIKEKVISDLTLLFPPLILSFKNLSKDFNEHLCLNLVYSPSLKNFFGYKHSSSDDDTPSYIFNSLLEHLNNTLVFKDFKPAEIAAMIEQNPHVMGSYLYDLLDKDHPIYSKKHLNSFTQCAYHNDSFMQHAHPDIWKDISNHNSNIIKILKKSYYIIKHAPSHILEDISTLYDLQILTGNSIINSSFINDSNISTLIDKVSTTINKIQKKRTLTSNFNTFPSNILDLVSNINYKFKVTENNKEDTLLLIEMNQKCISSFNAKDKFGFTDSILSLNHFEPQFIKSFIEECPLFEIQPFITAISYTYESSIDKKGEELSNIYAEFLKEKQNANPFRMIEAFNHFSKFGKNETITYEQFIKFVNHFSVEEYEKKFEENEIDSPYENRTINNVLTNTLKLLKNTSSNVYDFKSLLADLESRNMKKAISQESPIKVKPRTLKF
jgi:hypothetical protein